MSNPVHSVVSAKPTGALGRRFVRAGAETGSFPTAGGILVARDRPRQQSWPNHCLAHRLKRFCFPTREKPLYRSGPSRLARRGVCAIVTKREAGCDGREPDQKTNDPFADGEVVWFWHLDADAKLSGAIRPATATTSPIAGKSAKETVK